MIDTARSLVNEPLDSSRTFPDNTSSFWTDSVLIDYFNMVQHDVSLEIMQTFEDYFLTQSDFSIVAGTAEYSLPARTVKIRRVEDRRSTSEPTEIRPVTINDRHVERYLVNNDSAAFWAGGYYIRGDQVVFTDTPTFTNASAIRMFYIRALADVSAATASSDIPVEHHRIIVYGLVAHMLRQQQSDANWATLEYDKMMARLKLQCENRQIQRPRAVKSSYRRTFR